MKNYLEVKEGKNTFLRYVSSILVTILFVFIGSIVYAIIEIIRVELDSSDSTYFDLESATVVGGNEVLGFLLSHIPYLFALVGLWISVRFIHKRKLRTLVTAEKSWNWKRVFLGFAIFAILFLLTTGIDLIFNFDDYQWNNVSLQEYLFLIFVVLVFVPIQTTTEELMFRGLLLQLIGKILKKPVWLALVIGIIFGALHFANPEMNKSFILVGLDYIVAGFGLTYIAVKTGSLELSIGAHAANNMIICLLFTTTDSVAGEIPSLFRVAEGNPLLTLIWSIVLFIAFYFWSMKVVKKESIR